MSHPIDKGERRRLRYIKGMRRLREDRAEHTWDNSCPCLSPQAGAGRGKVFARFADYPAVCSCAACGNPRKKAWSDLLTNQEIRDRDRVAELLRDDKPDLE